MSVASFAHPVGCTPAAQYRTLSLPSSSFRFVRLVVWSYCWRGSQIGQVDADAARKSREAREDHVRQLAAKTKDSRAAMEGYCATSRDNVKRLKVTASLRTC